MKSASGEFSQAARPILVADDERGMRTALFEALTRAGLAVELAENGKEALEKFKANRFDLVITDVRMPGLGGLELLEEIKRLSPQTPVVLITGYGTVENAVEAMRAGAFDYIVKPFSLELIEETVDRALNGRGLSSGVAQTREADFGELSRAGDRPLITQDEGMKQVLKRARSVAASRATVLIQGESGTGKELLARFIHQSSDRAGGPFVAVNCASLPEGLLESELFGHEKGSFTGAYARKAGKFELAHEGTILLDEISEMDLSLQAKLLRVLQEEEIDRVGGKHPVRIDVRVMVTTNRNLKALVAEGGFRQDLYYRLNVIPLTIPPLRERPGDIPVLAQYFLEKYAAVNGRQIKGLAKKALARFKALPWPGNVRELENIVARGVLLAEGPEVQTEDLFLEEADPPRGQGSAPGAAGGPLRTIREMEKDLIERALVQTEGNRTHAARLLGISVRTLRNKLAEYKNGGWAGHQAA